MQYYLVTSKGMWPESRPGVSIVSAHGMRVLDVWLQYHRKAYTILPIFL